MTRIAIIVDLFPPKWRAGTELATYRLAKHLHARGNDVHVLTSRDRGMPKEESCNGVSVHRIYWPKKIPTLQRTLLSLEMYVALRKVNPQIVHVQNFTMGMCGLLAKRLSKKPYIVAGRGFDVYGLDRVYAKKLDAFFVRKALALIVKNADAVTALTEEMRREIQKVYARDATVIPNGIEVERFSLSLSNKDAREELKLENDARIVVSVASLSPKKGTEYLIRALKTIIEEEPTTKLYLIGKGTEEAKLRTLVQALHLTEYILFVGSIPNRVVPEYLAASDVFVLPSLEEAFGIVLLEAMAAGLPIVATNVGGIPSIVADGVNGFLVEPRNPAQIAEAVLKLLADKELTSTLTANNKELVKTFSSDENARQYEELYQRCIASEK